MSTILKLNSVILFSVFIVVSSEMVCAQALDGRVRVEDGKTILFISSGVSVRLHGIDGCEMKQMAFLDGAPWRCGVVAAGWLTQATLGYSIKCLKEDGEAGYAAYWARCFLPDGTDIARKALADGMAMALRVDGEAIVPAYAEIEAEARRDRRGIWSSSFEPPAKFRARK